MGSKIGVMAQELARTNPWWRDPGWARTDRDLAEAAASGIDYRPGCLDDLAPGGLYVLRGPRRVGKTVAVRQAIAHLAAAGIDPRTIVAFAADGASAKDLRTLAQNTAIPVAPPGASRWWFIDEVTAMAGDWAAQLKWLRDNDPAFQTATIVLTGSNAKNLSDAIGTLAGRRGKVTNPERTLLPVGFRTFVELLDPTVAAAHLPALAVGDLHQRDARDAYNELLPWLDVLVGWWERYLAYGGFPIAVSALANGQPIPSWFTDAMLDVVHRDAFGATRLAETDTTALLDRIARGLCSPFNTAQAGRDLDLSEDTTARRVADLRDSYLLWRCPQRHDQRWSPLPRSYPKLYYVDPVLAALAHLRRPASWGRPDLTALVEQQIGMAARRHVEARNPGSWVDDEHLFYQRTPSRKEIDFVGPTLNPVALEAKYVQDGGWAAEARTVDAAGYHGILTTRNVLDTHNPHGAWAIPAATIAYLIDN